MAKIFMKTHGCSLNVSDSEAMAALLVDAGFEFVETEEEADVIIVNTCTVKSPSVSTFLTYLRHIKEIGKHIVITGCIPQTTPEVVAGCSLVGTKQIDRIVEVVEETINGNVVSLLKPEDKDRLKLPRVRRKDIIEIIPICSGCADACAYCLTKRARGNLKSYPLADIIERAKRAVREGVKEIWLTSQDNGAYGLDLPFEKVLNTATGRTEDRRPNLATIVREISKIPGNFFIRVGMANPQHVVKYADELVEVMQHDKVFKFIHLPVQSGNDKVLESMLRDYTVQQFRDLVRKFRSIIPNIAIATDVICGFPGETHEQFLDTVNLMRELRPEVINISRYWERPNTLAEKMEQVPGGERKERSKLMTEVSNIIFRTNNEQWIGWSGRAVVDERGKNGVFIARNEFYKSVLLTGEFEIGEIVYVKITGSSLHDIIGKVIR